MTAEARAARAARLALPAVDAASAQPPLGAGDWSSLACAGTDADSRAASPACRVTATAASPAEWACAIRPNQARPPAAGADTDRVDADLYNVRPPARDWTALNVGVLGVRPPSGPWTAHPPWVQRSGVEAAEPAQPPAGALASSSSWARISAGTLAQPAARRLCSDAATANGGRDGVASASGAPPAEALERALRELSEARAALGRAQRALERSERAQLSMRRQRDEALAKLAAANASAAAARPLPRGRGSAARLQDLAQRAARRGAHELVARPAAFAWRGLRLGAGGDVAPLALLCCALVLLFAAWIARARASYSLGEAAPQVRTAIVPVLQ